MSEIKPCPCGKIPKELGITDAGQGGKWANVNGNCCGEWTVEFRTDYESLDSDKCKSLALEAWNESSRSDLLKANSLLETRCKELESALRKYGKHLIGCGWDKRKGRSIRQITRTSNCNCGLRKILDTPTTDEHLQKLFTEWLGEPVAERRKVQYKWGECYQYRDSLCVPFELLEHSKHFSPHLVENTHALYAPKKVSE